MRRRSMSGSHPSDDVAVFYINRDIDTERRRRIDAQLSALFIRYTRVAAVNGRELPSDLKRFFPFDTRLTPGELGCYASHLKVARLVLQRDLPCALVLEDDALLAPDFDARLDELVRRLPEGWDFVHLSGLTRRAVKPVLSLSDRSLIRFSRVPSGTVGYLISFQGARKLLKPCRRHWPIDTDIRQPWLFNLDLYGVSSPLVGHDDSLPSAIMRVGGRSRLRRGIRPSRHCPTGNPLKTPEGALFNIRNLGMIDWVSCGLSNGYAKFIQEPNSSTREVPRLEQALLKVRDQ
jgi:glycosyl transferase, family 25